MPTTVSLQPGGKSVQIQCDACGSPLRLSLLRPDGGYRLYRAGDLTNSNSTSRVQAAQRLLIASALTEAVQAPA